MTVSNDAAGPIAALLDQGQLAEAVAAAGGRVKAAPTSAPDRILLAELLVLEGGLERADAQLKLAADQAPAEALAIAQMRWLVRGAELRRAWFEEGAVPSFIGEPTAVQQDVMRLALAVRAGQAEEALQLRAKLEARDLPLAAVDGDAMADFRDGCDLSQHGFEVLTLDGRYLWLAPEQVSEMAFQPIGRPRDLVWRRADTTLSDGRDATFFVLAQYFVPEAGDAFRLGKETDWIPEVGGVMRGRGQRVFVAGDEGRGLLDIEHIAFQVAS